MTLTNGMRPLSAEEIGFVAGAGYSHSKPSITVTKTQTINNTQTNQATVGGGSYSSTWSELSQTNVAVNQIDSPNIIIPVFLGHGE